MVMPRNKIIYDVVVCVWLDKKSRTGNGVCVEAIELRLVLKRILHVFFSDFEHDSVWNISIWLHWSLQSRKSDKMVPFYDYICVENRPRYSTKELLYGRQDPGHK